MTSRDLCYWLQGFFELTEFKTLNAKQVDLIRKHLAMVFIHEIDPSMGNKEHQKKLDQVHNPSKIEELIRAQRDEREYKVHNEGQIQPWSTSGTFCPGLERPVVSVSNTHGVGFHTEHLDHI